MQMHCKQQTDMTVQTMQGTAEISHFCVPRAEQRGGIGSALLREVRWHLWCSVVRFRWSLNVMLQALDYCAAQLGSGGEVCLTVLKDLEAAR